MIAPNLEEKYAKRGTAEARGQLTLLGEELDDERGGGEGQAAAEHEGGRRRDAAQASSDRANDEAGDKNLR